MDSVTQIALGATVAASVGFKPFGRRTLLIGAFLGTVPDLDVFINYGNDIDNFTSHRGFSHSLFVLSVLSFLLYSITLKIKPQLKHHRLALFSVIFLPLITHPLLDAFTTYGTQLLWPLDSPPIAWHSIFIIDPLYTLPLLISALFLWFSANKKRWLRYNQLTLLVSCLYLAWGQFSQRMIAQHVKQSDFVKNKPLLIMPTPFNSFYWRVLSYQKDNYYEAFTYLGNEDPLHWSEYSHNRFLLDESQPNDLPRLEWFSDGWLRFDDVNGKLQVTDLRLGVTGYHPFTFEVAHKAQSKWQTVEPLQIEMEIDDIKLQQLFTELKTKIGLTP